MLRRAPAAARTQPIHLDDIDRFVIGTDLSVREAIKRIDQASEGLALVMDGERRLLATITDGDIRRALLAGVDLDGPVSALLACPRPDDSPAQPITAPYGTNTVSLLHLMSKRSIRHIPLLDRERRVVGIALLSRLMREQDLPLRAVIMAGGLGVRLRPLTETVPKPLLPVGDRPLLERTVAQLGQAGIRRVNIATHYLADQIVNHIGDGSSFGIAVEYSHEKEALGTAGALRGLGDGSKSEPLLVINGDVLTNVNFRALYDYHREHEARITIGVRRYAIKIPYGVVEAEGPVVRAIREKPEMSFFVNAGIYLLEPEVCREVPEGRKFDMTDLIESVVRSGGPVISFPIHEYWLDIGQLDDYQQAQLDANTGRLDA